MDQDEPSRIREATAAAVRDRAGPSEEARGLLAEGMAPRQYIEALAGRGLHADAIRILAFALPGREAVWWAWLCVAEMLGPEPPPSAASALEAARAWVVDPTDENRRAAFPAAEAADVGTPAGCVAAAAYFSGGSLAPPDLPEVAPPEHTTPHLVACALAMAAVVAEPQEAPERSSAFLRTGLEVAAGRIPWPGAPPETPAIEPKPAGPKPGEPRPADPISERDRRIAEMRARRARR